MTQPSFLKRPSVLTVFAMALALPLAACGGGGKTMAEDIKQFDALAQKTISKDSQELLLKMRAATTNPERGKFLAEYATVVDQQASTIAGYKADHPEVTAIKDKVAGGLKKSAAAARKGEAAFAKEDQSAMTAFAQEMNAGMQDVQAGAQDFKKLAADNKVDISI